MRLDHNEAQRVDACARIDWIISQAHKTVDEGELNFAIHQGRLFRQTVEPLTARAIIQIIMEKWRATAVLSDAERAYLIKFAAA